jgi:hypothetical protein
VSPLDDALVRIARKIRDLDDDGLCGCGCGEKAPIATGTDARYGCVEGQPRRFCRGHNTRLRRRRPFDEMYVVEDRGYVTPCWVWQGGVTGGGYGAMATGRSVRSAHVVAYELHIGPIPAGLVIDHLCRVRVCCNPEHLEAVTQAENVRRSGTAKLTHEQVKEIRKLAHADTAKVAERFGVQPASIANIWNGRTWVEEVAQ